MNRFPLIAATLLTIAVPSIASAQATTPAPTPAIRRWVDVQALQAGARFRWNRNSADRVTTNSLQWHGQLRGRLLFDAGGKVSLNTLASTGTSFVSSWNDTGVGLGDYVGKVFVKQLFLAATPVKGLELQVGGLFLNRGDVSENTSYDMDGYVVGERVIVRPSKGRVTQLSFTAGHIADFAAPNVFKRLDDMVDFNYGQVLVGFTLSPRMSASVDYTHEDGRDILRQGVTLRMPATVKLLTALRGEAYQRISDNNPAVDDAFGFNAAADLRWRKLSVTAGVMSVDRLARAINGDRYATGKRWYSIGSLALTQDFTLGWFHGQAFDNSFPVALKRRFDVILTFNPTARLKRAGIF